MVQPWLDQGCIEKLPIKERGAKMNLAIQVKNSKGKPIASGILQLELAAIPPRASFTPQGGFEKACNGVEWSLAASGAVKFIFKVDNEANGDFPKDHIYTFTGTQKADGFPHGKVNFPSSNPVNDDDDTWQSTAVPEEVKEGAKKSTYNAGAS